MKDLLARIDNFSGPVTYENLGELVASIDLNRLDWKTHLITECDPGDYARNILRLDPFELVLIYWPPGIASAVHYHAGFYGYVLMLDGALENVEYSYEDGILSEFRVMRYLSGGIAPEPEGVIHKLANPDPERPAVSLHFYYPALETLEDLVIYDLENRKEGVLSATAKSASWSEASGHFKEVREEAFEFQDLVTTHHHASHLIHPVIPKPNKETINTMLGQYYAEQAKQYDQIDQKVPKRQAYTSRINQLIADDLAGTPRLEHMLCIAVGTGRRSEEIRNLSGRDYHIVGVDMSAEMCDGAAERGLTTINASWLEADLGEEREPFCAATWLYAFGHLANRKVRLQALQKINRHLKMGAAFYFDVFNLENRHEWGPLALKAHREFDLGSVGYEEGDVFYQKADGNSVAFLHYFQEDELRELLSVAGFRMARLTVIGYAHESGQIMKRKDEGSFFVKAVKEREI